MLSTRPVRRAAAALALAAAAAGGLRAAEPKALDQARAALLEGDPAAAVYNYSAFARASGDAALTAEYAYALAAAGFGDAALAQLDRAFLLDAADDDVRFFAAAVLAAAGLPEAARELARPAPAWLAGREPALAPGPHAEPASFREGLRTAGMLLGSRRFASAADRCALLTRSHPAEALGWSCLAIALEKLGARQAAAAAVAKDLDLSRRQDDAATVAVLETHRSELAAPPPQVPPPGGRAGRLLQGRYLAFFGGSLLHNDAGSIVNLNGRLGRFLTNRCDAGLALGYTSGYDDDDYNGLSAGLSGRYHQPVGAGLPLNVTAGARLQYAPAPSDRLSVVLSPGLSLFRDQGSLDFYLDYGVTGPLEGALTLSLGYTAYFGGAS